MSIPAASGLPAMNRDPAPTATLSLPLKCERRAPARRAAAICRAPVAPALGRDPSARSRSVWPIRRSSGAVPRSLLLAGKRASYPVGRMPVVKAGLRALGIATDAGLGPTPASPIGGKSGSGDRSSISTGISRRETKPPGGCSDTPPRRSSEARPQGSSRRSAAPMLLRSCQSSPRLRDRGPRERRADEGRSPDRCCNERLPDSQQHDGDRRGDDRP